MREPVTMHAATPRVPARTDCRRARGRLRTGGGATLLLVALLPSLLLPGPARAACSGNYMTFDTASFSAVIGQSKPVTVMVTNQNVNWANDNYIEVRYDLRNAQGQVVGSAVLLGSFGFPGCGTPIAVQGTFSTSGLTVGSYTIQWYIENVQGTGTYSAFYGVIVTAPAPSLSSLVPTSVLVGSPGVTLTVNGTNFTSQSVVRWNGANRPTTFVSSTALSAATQATVADRDRVQSAIANQTTSGQAFENLESSQRRQFAQGVNSATASQTYGVTEETQRGLQAHWQQALMEEIRTGEASRDTKAKIDDSIRRAGGSAEGHLGYRGTWGSVGIGAGAGADWVWRTSDGREYTISLHQATSDRLLKSTETRLAQNQTYQHLSNEARVQMKASRNEAMFSRTEQARASFRATREEARRVQQDTDLSERYEAVVRADIMPQVLYRLWEAQGTGMSFGQAIASGDSPAVYLTGSFATRIDNLTRTAAGRQEFIREAWPYIQEAGLYEKVEEARTAIRAR